MQDAHDQLLEVMIMNLHSMLQDANFCRRSCSLPPDRLYVLSCCSAEL
jgi:hypothetical protein